MRACGFKTLSVERYAWWMSKALGVGVSPSAVSQQLDQLGITRKTLETLYEE